MPLNNGSRSGGIMLIGMIFLALPLVGNLDGLVQEANASLQQGEKATAYEERKDALNHALSLYHVIEQTSPSPSLTRIIGDVYFQLGEYPWAVLYYQRTLKNEPQDPIAVAHLEAARQKLGIADHAPAAKEQNPFVKGFAALAGHDLLLFWAILLTFLACSFAIWLPSPFLRKAAGGCSVIALLLLINFTVFYYSAPLEGILIAPTGFYQAPGKNQPQLTSLPLLAGSKVNVLQLSADGEWLRITNDAGLIGYVPASALRLI